jgi:hypothetical protein
MANPFDLHRLFPDDDDIAKGCGCGICLLALAALFGAGLLAMVLQLRS